MNKHSEEVQVQVQAAPSTPADSIGKESLANTTPATSPDSTYNEDDKVGGTSSTCDENENEDEESSSNKISLEDGEDHALEEEDSEQAGTSKLYQHQYQSIEGSGVNVAPVPSSRACPSKTSKAPSAQPSKMSNQQALMIESGKLLEHLRQEIYKLRSQNSQLRNDFESLQGNNQRLMDANGSLGSTFDTVNKHAKQVSKANSKLKQDLQKTKDKMFAERAEYNAQIEALKMSQLESKEELKMKHGTYIAEVHSRLHYQKVLANIVDKIQERCRDHRLVEEILAMGDECEL